MSQRDNSTMDEMLENVNELAEETIQLLMEANEEDLSESDIPTGKLVETLGNLKSIEKQTEEFRKEIVESELETRISIGDTYENDDHRATLVEGHRKYVLDEDEALQQLEEFGIDPRDVMSVNASSVHEKSEEVGLDPHDFIGKHTYTFFRVS